MGSQVAWQMAFHGKYVTVYDAIPAGLEKGKALHRDYAEHFRERRGATAKSIDDRPQQFLALHFTIGVWDSNVGEVMGHPGTDPAVFERVLSFAGEIGLVPLRHDGSNSRGFVSADAPRAS